ncbi:MAG TPA: TadE/TadG family type IV pilus assembly protein [Planctomycetaceae bacterium]|nr:TadE/TadG family type IV pilus assembly protein [Planctomycetaceae bacterium]
MRRLTTMRRHQNPDLPERQGRKAAAMVECAVTLPVLIVMVLGILEIGSALRASTILQSACRESGRLAAMDWRYVVSNNQTPNQKVIQDLKNYVTAAGLRGSQATVTITYADGNNAGQTFDLADPDNDLKFCRVQATLPYSSVSVFPVTYLEGKTLKASMVIRATTKGGSLSN